MAVVCKAYQPSLKRYVALKVLLSPLVADPDFVERFLREARMAAGLEHPHIIPIYDVGVEGDIYYIAMRFIEGQSLKIIIKQGALPPQWVAGVINQVASALDYAHKQGVVHRDVKPSNILIGNDGNVALTDFGIAIGSAGSRLTKTGCLAGTPEYMSPEQAKGEKVDYRSDIYSLGIVAYEMLTGRAPFVSDTPHAVLLAQIGTPPPMLRMFQPSISPAVEMTVLTALAKEPEQRYGSAGELARALSIAVTTPVVVEGSTEGRLAGLRLPKLSDLRAVAPTAFLVLMLVFLVVLSILLISSRRAPGAAIIEQAPSSIPTVIAAPVLASVEPTATAVPIPTTTPIAIPSPTAIPLPTASPVLTPEIGATQVWLMDGATMVYVPAGEFLMGSGDSDTMAGSEETPPHMVYLDSFWIDRTEVTNAQYTRCVQAGVCKVPYMKLSFTRSSYYDNPSFNDYPVIYVSWNDAKIYCEWAGKRLPTEAEWEKAARSGTGSFWPWGNDWDASKANAEGRIGDTTAVGKYPTGASPYGALDMAGNVSEWVADWYSENYYSVSPKDNPTGPSSGRYRVLRGGSWDYDRKHVRAASRNSQSPDERGYNIGFRCVVQR
jgi:serine/threonine-protein kinase